MLGDAARNAILVALHCKKLPILKAVNDSARFAMSELASLIIN